jgi:ribulose-phosphate 3-epimerase
MKRLIAPSILTADFTNLGSEIRMLNLSEADMIHLDIMDGVFVPNISFGLPVTEQINKISEKPLDVHLMIENPDPYIHRFREAGAAFITVHWETCRHLHRTIESIKDSGAYASVCLNPHTPPEFLSEIIPDLDMVLLMSVNPGFGGQKFIDNTYSKVRKLREIIDRINPECLIEVDGGVNFETGKKLFEAGANVLVSGNFVFSSDDPIKTIRQLKNL